MNLERAVNAKAPGHDAPKGRQLVRAIALGGGLLCCLAAGWFAQPSRAATPSPVALRFESPAGKPLETQLVAEAGDPNLWTEEAVHALSRSAQPWFGLWLGEARADLAPLAGTYERRGAQLRFRPSLPLLPGQTYTARLELHGLKFRTELRTEAAAPATTPRLLAIYPTTDRLPANHLKFYLVFSEPMETGVFLNYCRLTDAQGKLVEAPFRETELWSVDGRRLTLWFHPGRQKTGVNLNVEFGPVLEAGREYRLVIDGRWPSAHGVPLGEKGLKTFHTVPPLREQLTVKNWQIHPPMAGTRDPLSVTLPQPLDWATLQRQLHVTTGAGTVPGAVTVERGEREWSFVPEQVWQKGPHEIRVGTAIEDQAGNSLARPFEVDLNLQLRARAVVPPEIGIPFAVR